MRVFIAENAALKLGSTYDTLYIMDFISWTLVMEEHLFLLASMLIKPPLSYHS